MMNSFGSLLFLTCPVLPLQADGFEQMFNGKEVFEEVMRTRIGGPKS
jgi:hypothetical protein